MMTRARHIWSAPAHTIAGSSQTARLAVTLAIAGLAAACASYRAKPLDPAEHAAQYAQRTLTSADVDAFARQNGTIVWPPAKWDLDALTLAAFYYHPDLDVARANFGIARAGVITAGARPNPSLSLQVQNASSAGDQSAWTLGFNLDIPIETAGKRGYRARRARSLLDSARFNIAAVAWQVRSRLRAVLIDYANARESVDVLTRQRDIQADIVDILQKRLAQGEGSLLEATQVKISASQTALQLRDAERRRDEVRTRVAQSIGIPVAALDTIDLAVPELSDVARYDVSREDLRTAALTRRADLLVLLAEYTAAETAFRLEIAKQYPDLHLGPGFSWDQGVRKWSLGFSAGLPLLNQNQGPIAEAEARRAEVAARFDALQARVVGDLDRALASYRAAIEKLAAARTLLEMSEQQEREVRRRLEAGETDRLDLRTNELQTNTSALARLDAMAAAAQAIGAVEDAVQQPLTGGGVDPAVAMSREEKP